MTLSKPRILPRGTAVPTPYAYPSLTGNLAVALVKDGGDGLLYPVNKMAMDIANLAGTPHISDHTRQAAKSMGVRFEMVPERVRRL